MPDETTLLAGLGDDDALAVSTTAAETGAAEVPAVARTSALPLDPNAPPPRAPGRAWPPAPPSGGVRPLMAARDDRRALYLNTPGLWVGLKSERLVVRDKDKTTEEVRLRDVNHLALFGNIQLSTQAVQQLCELEIPITYFSMGGWFYGLTRGHGLKNVLTRVEQFRRAADPAASLALAKQFIHGKIRNQRTLLMRNHVEPPDAAILRLKQAAKDVFEARSAGELLGMEGAAAAVYFAHFGGMIKVGARRDWRERDAGRSATAAAARARRRTWCTFDFNGRNRRPPRDPVNALLSLAYSLLAKDCTIGGLAVGFDPYIGFFHQPRAGRPALALDLQEEFRPLVADSAVLTAFNNRMVEPGGFSAGGRRGEPDQDGSRSDFSIVTRSG